jgi:hypothetical protein
MRLTVWQQQTKALQQEQLQAATAASKQVNSIKHLLWHGNVGGSGAPSQPASGYGSDSEALHSGRETLRGIGGIRTYIRNNQEYIPNYGELYRQGETISTAFVESTINQVVSRRFVKLQQMHWTLRGAHLLLQTRTKVLNNELERVLRRWWPLFRIHAHAA